MIIKILNFFKNLLIPYEGEDFIKLTQNDLWNQFIYQNIYPDLLPKKDRLYKLLIQKNKLRLTYFLLDQGTNELQLKIDI